MAFQDYPLDPNVVTTIGGGVFIGPNMARDQVRPALQQLAADGRAVFDYAERQGDATLAAAQAIVGPTYTSTAAGLAATTNGQNFAADNGDGTVTIYRNTAGTAVAQRNLATVAFMLQGPNTPSAFNVYQVDGDPGRKARQLFKPTNRGAHIGEQFTGLGVEFRPTGSGANGPADADMGLNVSVIKSGTAVGEIDGINVVVRQAGAASDACGLLVDVAGWNGGTGFWGLIEGSTKHIDGGGTTLKDVRVQIGVIDTVNSSEFAFYSHAVTGVIDTGIFLRSSGGSFTNYITFVKDAATIFNVAGSGETNINVGVLGTALGDERHALTLEASTGNTLTAIHEFNRYAAGSDWTSTEYRIGLRVDGATAAASNPWMALRGRSGSFSSVVFGFGEGDTPNFEIPVEGGVQIEPVTSTPPSPSAGRMWFNATTDQWNFTKNSGVIATL